MHSNKGFSLIELMIVVAIIGILSLFATSEYKKYVYRVKVAELLSFANYYKSELVSFYIENERCPNNVNGPDGSFPKFDEITSDFSRSLTVGDSNVGFYIGLTDEQIANGVKPSKAHRYIVSKCYITAAYKEDKKDAYVPPELKSRALRLRMAIDSSGIYWQCSVDRNKGIPFKYLPPVCRNSINR